MILKTKLLGHVYEFKSVKDALAKANEEKSGDRLAGIAAENAPPFPTRRTRSPASSRTT